MERQSGRAKKRESQRHIRRCAREPPAPCCARDTPTPAIALAHIHEPGRPVLGAVAGDQHVRRPVARNPATPQHEFAFLRWRCCGVGEGMWRGNGGGGRGGGIDSVLGYRGGKKQPTRDATADQNARATIQQLLRHAKSRPMSPAAGEIGPVLQPGPVSSSLHMSLPLTPVARAVSLDLSRPVSRADTSMGKRAYHRGEVDELCSGCIVGSWLVHGADASPRARFHRPTSCVSMAASHCAKPCIYLDVPGLAVRTAAQREAAHGPGLGSGTGLQQFRLGRTGSCHKAGRLPE